MCIPILKCHQVQGALSLEPHYGLRSYTRHTGGYARPGIISLAPPLLVT